MASSDTENLATLRHGRSKGRVILPNLGLHLSERKLLLGFGDLLMLNAALLAYINRSETWFKPSLDDISSHMEWFFLYSVLWVVASVFMENYDLAKSADSIRSTISTALTALIISGIYLLIPYVTPVLPDRRLYIFLLPVLSVLFVAGWRIFYATVFVQPAFRRTAIIVGAGWSGQTLVEVINTKIVGKGTEHDSTTYMVYGFVDDDPAKQDTYIDGYPVLGTSQSLMKLVEELDPDELIVAITHSQLITAPLFKAILDCRELGVTVNMMTNLYENITGKVPVEHVGRDLRVILPNSGLAENRFYKVVGRLFDLLVSIPGCLFFLVLTPCIWLANMLSDKGDLFYTQVRVGRGGRLFRIIKFRSMIMGAEQDTGAVWADLHDERITRVGKFLRKTRLDEFPQFWNVLKGEMSLIGPRPERPEIVDNLADELPFYRVRNTLRPGITGWAQVQYRYGSSVNDALIKLQYDLYYIKNQGFYLDFLILIKTIKVILGFKGQ